MTRLEEIRERAEAAPKGDWYVEGDGSVWVDHSGGESFSMSGLTGALPVWAEGAGPFIAHAPADIAALTAAIDAVMAVHQPKRWTEYNISVFDEFDKSTQVHDGCSCGSKYYPCPTVTAITTALGSQP